LLSSVDIGGLPFHRRQTGNGLVPCHRCLPLAGPSGIRLATIVVIQVLQWRAHRANRGSSPGRYRSADPPGPSGRDDTLICPGGRPVKTRTRRRPAKPETHHRLTDIPLPASRGPSHVSAVCCLRKSFPARHVSQQLASSCSSATRWRQLEMAPEGSYGIDKYALV
jgi:hypothetical protein